VATLPVATRNAFLADLSTVQDTARTARVSSRIVAEDNTWVVWRDFCMEHSVDPLLESVTDPIPYFQVFGHRYRNGKLAKDGKPVFARTVEDAMRQIGQTMASLGAKDHRLVAPKQIDFRLRQQIAAYKTVDPPPRRVKPVPLGLIDRVHCSARESGDTFELAVADMAVVGFFYLCRPGEYADTSKSDAESDPFRLMDVDYTSAAGTFNVATSPVPDQLLLSHFISLTFTTQKNGVQGEKIGHGKSSDPFLCPVQAITRRVQHLLAHHAPPDTPLYRVYQNGSVTSVRSTHITRALRDMARLHYNTFGLCPEDISARSLRAGGAMALLCAAVDTDVIKLVGRWRSDTMLRYLHLQAYPKMGTFAHLMCTHGTFTLLPSGLPATALPILMQAPVPP